LYAGYLLIPGHGSKYSFPDKKQNRIENFRDRKEIIGHSNETGTLITDGKKIAKIALKNGYLHLKSVQAPGKKRMEIGELLRGMR